MIQKDKEWVEAQGLAAAQDLRRVKPLTSEGGSGIQIFMTSVVRMAFAEGMKRGDYKCVDFLRTTGQGYVKMGFVNDGREFLKAAVTVEEQLNRKYAVDPEREASNAARNTFGN